MTSQRATSASGSGNTSNSCTGKGFSHCMFLPQDRDTKVLFVSLCFSVCVDLLKQISCDMEPLSLVHCSVSPPLASFFEAGIAHMYVCVCVCACLCVHVVPLSRSSISFRGAMVSQGFPVCLPGEAACFSLRCQFGCQMEQGEAVSCLCPPGLHLAADNRTCEGDASSKNTPSIPRPPGHS